VTRSEAGITLFHKEGLRQDFPVKIREVKDVTGAGDTVLAMLTTAIANGLTVGEAAQLSNFAAGIAIERFGCARISLQDLALRLLEFDVINKVFDEEHLFALQQAMKGKHFTLLGVHGTRGLSSRLFCTIRELSQQPNRNLLVYIRDHEPNEEFVNIIASLHEVNFVIVNAASLRSLCRLIEPDEVYLFDNDESRRLDHTNALLG
jgi:D-glycero-beta-D-manno-heptose-7-phosphate kinase